MKYRLTPLHFVAGYLVIRMFYYRRVIDMESAELGGLFPMILFGMMICSLSFDLLIQWVFSRNKKILYAFEGVLVLILLIWYIFSFGFTHI